MTRSILPSLLILFIFLLSACQEGITDSERVEDLPYDLSAAEMELIERDNAFSYDLFRQVHAAEAEEGDEPENIFISPLSVSMALGMTVNGAAGETREEMKQALRKEGMSMEEINRSYRSLVDLLVNLDPGVQVQIANSLWYREDIVPKEQFRNELETYFDAVTEGRDFSDPKTVDRINGWVNEQTEGLIQKIVQHPISSDIVAYLINALHFKGDWTRTFDAEETREAPFTLESGETVEVEMMQKTEEKFAAFENEAVRMLDLPYGDSLFSMTLMMPADEGETVGEFIRNTLNGAVVNEWIDQLREQEASLYLPKFTTEYEIDLVDVMKALGMESAFALGIADFSNMYEGGGVALSEIKHKTFIDLNEEGTEAAAVTAISVAESLPPQYRFDRPFVYLIRERISGTILFMGTMQNPAR